MAISVENCQFFPPPCI